MKFKLTSPSSSCPRLCNESLREVLPSPPIHQILDEPKIKQAWLVTKRFKGQKSWVWKQKIYYSNHLRRRSQMTSQKPVSKAGQSGMSGALYAADPGSIPDKSNALFSEIWIQTFEWAYNAQELHSRAALSVGGYHHRSVGPTTEKSQRKAEEKNIWENY